MEAVKTSISHPLQIAEVSAGEGYGQIGITFCPGKQDRFAASGVWQRDLNLDLQVISEWGAKRVLTLVEAFELQQLQVPELGEAVLQMGMAWHHLPIVDYSTPNERFEAQWLMDGLQIRQHLRLGDKLLIHCKGGLGRAGMMAARLLVELGMEAEQAITQVRQARKGAIETPAQLALVRATQIMADT